MKKSIFISRILETKSPFFNRLSSKQYQVLGASLVEFTPIETQQIPMAAVFFFYSKKGIEFALQNLKLKALLHQKELAVMGAGTADFARQNGLTIAFVGTGNPVETAKRLEVFLEQRSILFLRAENSRKSVQQLLLNPKKVSDLVIYSNQIKEKIDIPLSDILVFTSPMNAKAYFSNYDLQNRQQVFAIGHTTAQALHDLGIKRIVIAKNPSENALVDAVLGL